MISWLFATEADLTPIIEALDPHQNPPTTPWPALTVKTRPSPTMAEISRALDVDLADNDLDVPSAVLSLLVAYGPMSAREISAALATSAAAVRAVLRTLIRFGAVRSRGRTSGTKYELR